ncbi:MAG: hypothetical protein QM820_10625 [Minicystis sp.]
MNGRRVSAALAIAALLVAGPAQAYVGPGAGVSLLGAVIGLGAAIATAVGFILLWPVRVLWRRLQRRKAAAPPPEQP